MSGNLTWIPIINEVYLHSSQSFSIIHTPFSNHSIHHSCSSATVVHMLNGCPYVSYYNLKLLFFRPNSWTIWNIATLYTFSFIHTPFSNNSTEPMPFSNHSIHNSCSSATVVHMLNGCPYVRYYNLKLLLFRPNSWTIWNIATLYTFSFVHLFIWRVIRWGGNFRMVENSKSTKQGRARAEYILCFF